MTSNRQQRKNTIQSFARFAGTSILVVELFGFGMLAYEMVLPTVLRLPNVSLADLAGSFAIVAFVLVAQVILLPIVLTLFDVG